MHSNFIFENSTIFFMVLAFLTEAKNSPFLVTPTNALGNCTYSVACVITIIYEH